MAEFGAKDVVYSVGTLVAVVNLVRSIIKERSEPLRQDAIRVADELAKATAVLASEVARYLQGHKEALSYADILRQDKDCRRILESLQMRLLLMDSDPVFKAYVDWWSVQSEDPFAQTKPKPLLKPTSPGIKVRQEAHAKLARVLDQLHHDLLSGIVTPPPRKSALLPFLKKGR